MRARAKVDANQCDIVAALRAIGCTVVSLAAVGRGVPDLLVGRHGRTYLLECKDGRQPPSARQLTEDQLKWHGAWKGGTLGVVCDVESAIRAVSLELP